MRRKPWSLNFSYKASYLMVSIIKFAISKYLWSNSFTGLEVQAYLC